MAGAKRKINPELAALRADIARKQRNAAAKIRRIEKTTGAVLGASPVDPRVNARKFAKYTATQLIAHAKRLDDFTSRNNQFVAGAGGVPISKRKYDEYKALERRNNELGASRMAERGHLVIPGINRTIKDREADLMNGGSARAHGQAVNKPYSRLERESFNIAGMQALDKLIKDMNKKIGREYLPAKVKAGRHELSEMLKTIGNNELKRMADDLTDYQFDIFWHETMGAIDASLLYEITKRQARGERDRSDQSILEDNADELANLFTWASRLPKESPTAKGRK